MNHFQLNYIERLQIWNNLRQDIKDLPIKEKCIAVDNWWQRAPLINHYLHPSDIEQYPNPWELLHENTYCKIARGLGICYTLKLLNVNDIKLVEANDDVEDTYIVLVDCGKYILNYHPNSVISISLHDFKIKKEINIFNLLSNIK